jgi:hypothetical protein
MRSTLERFLEAGHIHRVDAVTMEAPEYLHHVNLSYLTAAPASPKVVVITLSHRRAIEQAYKSIVKVRRCL